VNYDGSKATSYIQRDPLVLANGAKIRTTKSWRNTRRPELLELFRTHVYGRCPGRPKHRRYELLETELNALGGGTIRKQVRVHFDRGADGPVMDLLIYVPKAKRKKSPAFLAINFNGNHDVSADAGISMPERWIWERRTKTERFARADEKTRGAGAGQWPVDRILERGYALVTFARSDIEPDYPEGWRHGVRGYYLKQAGKAEFGESDWGAIAAWSWALSRALDYLETDPDIDAKRVAVLGHSRLGKAALWAGAQDERFALVISNNSGEGGATLARRNFNKSIGAMNNDYPHWFCTRYKSYNADPLKLPVDQHELIALIAPRPVYIASAQEDHSAHPLGEFLAAKNAEPVYRLYRKPGLGATEQPASNVSVGEFIGYHIRSGKHDLTSFDWEQFMNFADLHLGAEKGRPTAAFSFSSQRIVPAYEW